MKFAGLLLILSTMFIGGCSSTAQSREAIYVDGLKITLYPSDHAYPQLSDIYHGPNPPCDTTWWNQAFIIKVEAKTVDGDVSREGLRIDARKVGSWNYSGIDGANVFDDSDGRGYFDFYAQDIGHVSDDYEWITARTNAEGYLCFIMGVGDPGFNLDVNHIGNPSLYITSEDIFSSVAEFELRIRSNGNGGKTARVHCVVTKVEGQHFGQHDGIPGVYNVNYCGLGPYSQKQAAAESPGSPKALLVDDAFLLTGPPSLPETSCKPALESLLLSRDASATASSVSGDPEAGLPFSVLDAQWLQLAFNSQAGWYLACDNPFAWIVWNLDGEPTWSGPMPCTDPNSPDMWLQRLIDDSQPIIHYLCVEFEQPFPPDVASCVLRVSKGFDPNEWLGDPAQDADFNGDGKINLLDCARLSREWLNDSNLDPNAVVSLDRNRDGSVGAWELSLLAEFWLRNNSEVIESGVLFSTPFYYRTMTAWEGGSVHELITPYIVPVDSAEFQGRYVDSFSGPTYLVYMPPGSKLEISPVENGDYNGDGVVNLVDYAELYKFWLTETYNPAMDFNTDGIVDEQDLRGWIKEWKLR